MTRCLTVAALLLALLPIGCAQPPPVEQKKARPGFDTGLPVEPGYAQQFGYSLRWVYTLNIGAGQTLDQAKVLGDLLVTVERPGNIITGVSLGDATLRFKTAVGNDLERVIGVVGDDEHLYANTALRQFTLNRKNGELTYVSNLQHAVDAAPVLIGRRAIFGAVNGRVFSHDIVAGYTRSGNTA